VRPTSPRRLALNTGALIFYFRQMFKQEAEQ
jgi:hypothetical protein